MPERDDDLLLNDMIKESLPYNYEMLKRIKL